MATNRILSDIGKFLATQIESVKLNVDNMYVVVKKEIDSFDIRLGNMSKKQDVFYDDFTGQLKSSEERFVEKAALVDDTVTTVNAQEKKISKNINDTNIIIKSMNNRIIVNTTKVDVASTDVDGLNSAVLDLAAETSTKVEALDAKLVAEINGLLSLLDGKITFSNNRIDDILALSDSDKDSFAETVAYIMSIDAENDINLSSYINSNNSSVSLIRNALTDLTNKHSTLTTTVNANKSAAIIESAAINSKINIEKGRIDSILSASGADKDSFKEIVDFVNSIDIVNDANLATFTANVNSSIATHQTLINNRYSKNQADANFLGINNTAVAASKFALPRTISLTGGVTGNVVFDGSKNVSMTTTFDPTQHNHDSLYLGKTAKAEDSQKLDGLDSTQFVRSDVNPTINNDLVISSEIAKITLNPQNASYSDTVIAASTEGISIYNPLSPIDVLSTIGANGIDSKNGYSQNGKSLDEIYVGVSGTAANADKLDGIDSSKFVQGTSRNALSASALSVNDRVVTLHKGDGTSESVTVGDRTLTNTEVQAIIGTMVETGMDSGILVSFDASVGTLTFDVKDPVITLSGDINGSAMMSNLGNLEIVTTIADDSHNHIISNIDGLQASLDNKTSLNSKQVFSSTPITIGIDSFTLNFADGTSTSVSMTGENLWRPVVDSLTSTSATSGLSAKQGKILNENKLDKTANAVSSTRLVNPRTIALNGDINGSVSFDGTQNVTINTVIADDSHNHIIGNVDGLQTALNNKTSVNSKQVFSTNPISIKDGSFTLNFADGSTHEVSLSASNSWRPVINSLTSTDTDYGLTAYMGKQLNDNKLGKTANAVSATKLATPRVISLSGDINGSVSFDGTSNTNIVATIADDSHNHTIANVDGLQTALNNKLGVNSTSVNSSLLEGKSVADIKSEITAGAPGALDTLNELAAALGDDANFATTITNKLATKVDKNTDNTITGKVVISQPTPGKSSLVVSHPANDPTNTPAIIIATDGESEDIIADFRSNSNGVAVDISDTADSADSKVKIYGDGEITVRGNKVYHAGNDGVGSGLDADKLDGLSSTDFLRNTGTAINSLKFNGLDTSKFSKFSDVKSGNCGAGWITVAKSSGSRGFAEVYIWDVESGDHGFMHLNVMRSYADNTITVLNAGGHARRITGARWIRDTDSTYGVKKLQIFSTVQSVYNVIVKDSDIIPGFNNTITAYTPRLEFLPTNWYVTGGAISGLDNASGYLATTGAIKVDGNTVWHSGNDGAGSGLDADRLDGYESSQFLRTDGVQTTNDRLNVTAGANKGLGFPSDAFGGSGDTASIYLDNPTGSENQELTIKVTNDANDIVHIKTPTSTGFKHNSNTVWTSGNDGSGSGLDADKLDGIQASQFVRTDRDSIITGSMVVKQPTAGKSSLVVAHPSNDGNNTPAIIIATDGEATDIIADFRANVDGVSVDTSTSATSADSKVKIYGDGEITVRGNKVYHAGNDGAGSGLDADKLDGLSSSSFLRADTSTTISGNLSAVNLSATGAISTNIINNATGQQLILNAGESANKAGNQTNEYVYINAEQGISVNTPDTGHNNWQTGYSVKTAVIKGDSITLSGNKVWHSGNDGSGSGLDADKLDGIQASQFLRNDITNSTISTNTLHSNISPTSSSVKVLAQNTDLNTLELSGYFDFHTNDLSKSHAPTTGWWYIISQRHSNNNGYRIQIAHALTTQTGHYMRKEINNSWSSWTKVDASADITSRKNPTFDAGTSTTLTIKSNDNGVSKLLAIGDSQGTGAVEVGQSTLYGGGMCYNGDSSPSYANDEASDHIGFYRNIYGTKYTVFDYSVGNNVVRFRDVPKVKVNGTYQKVIHEGTLASSFKTINGESILGSGNIKIDGSVSNIYASIKTMGIYVHGTSSALNKYTKENFNSNQYINNPLSWLYTAGNVTDYTFNISSVVSPKLELVELGKFDISANHYDLSDSRVNTEIGFYDENNIYLGKFVYTKDINTWSRGDYGTAAFYRANGTLIYDIPVSQFAGTSYGNGSLQASIDLSVADKMVFYPSSVKSNSHRFSVTRTYAYAHPFNRAKYMNLTPKIFRAGYYKSSSSLVVSNVFGGIIKINR